MSKHTTRHINANHQDKGKPPRFESAISTEEMELAKENCETWAKQREAMLALLAQDSKQILKAYPSDAQAAGDRWIETMAALTEYRDHLFQCLNMTTSAITRHTMIGVHLTKGMPQGMDC